VATWEHHGRTPDYLGTAPEKLAVLREVEQAGLLSSESGVEYALQSRRRASRNRLMKQGAVSGICALTVVASIAWLVALKQKQEAQHAAATSNRTTQFMVSLFAVADPDESQGDTLTARQVLERGASEITGNGEHGLQKEPAIQAELLTAMGQSYTGLGLYESAEKLLAQAETDETKVVVPDESQVRTLLASGTVLFQLSQYKKAEVPLRKAVVLARRSLSALSTLRSQALTGLADDLSALFKFDEATALCNEALAADRQRVSAENGSNETLAALAKTLDSMGDNYLSEKKLSEAKDNLREAVALRKKVLGMHSVLTGQSLNNLGVVLYESGRYQESLAAYKSVLPIYSEVYGEKHREIATLLSNLGGSELMLGDIDGAQAYLKRALAMTDELEGRNHEDVVPPLNRLAMIDEYRGRLESADTEIRRAAEIARMPEHGALLNQVLLTQGNLEFLKGNHSVAAELLLESKQALDKIKDKDKDKGKEYAWQEALWRAVNAQITASNGDIAAAKITLTDAQSVLSQRFGDGSFYMLVVKRIGQSIDATPSGQRH
jgi:tetratricopeptide (TPR) repeat protein